MGKRGHGYKFDSSRLKGDRAWLAYGELGVQRCYMCITYYEINSNIWKNEPRWKSLRFVITTLSSSGQQTALVEAPNLVRSLE
jgi:hypothetical protein